MSKQTTLQVFKILDVIRISLLAGYDKTNQ